MAHLSKEAYTYYIGHPVEFVQDAILKLTPTDVKRNKLWKRLEPESKQMLHALAYNRFVSVRAGRGVGKTATLAFAIQWFMFTRPNAKVLVTGPKFDNLKSTIWRELQLWHSRSMFTSYFNWSSEKFVSADPRYAGTWMAEIQSAREAANISGTHAKHLLIIIDEAAGLSDEIYTILQGCMTFEDNRMMACGNPLLTSGWFYNTWTKNSDLWKCLHYSSEESSIVHRDWLTEMQNSYSRDDDIYRVHVLGEVPHGNPSAIISLAECEQARMREIEKPEKYLEMGVDPAWRGDDRFVVTIRQGLKQLDIKSYTRLKTQEQYRHVIDMLRKWRKATGIQSKVRIKIDAGGGYGASLIDNLSANTKDNVEVVAVYFGGGGNDEYANYGTIMWYNMKSIIDEVSLVNDASLIAELSRREFVTAVEKVRVEEKSKYRDRCGKSPDLADATILCYAEGPKKIFARADDSEPNVQDVKIDWYGEFAHTPGTDFMQTQWMVNYAGVVLTTDLCLYALCAFYAYYEDKLYIYAEVESDSPMPEKFVPAMKHYTQYGKWQDHRNVRVFGNKEMYSSSGKSNRRPFAQILRMEPYSFNTIDVQSYYDEYQAIGLGAQMFQDNKIVWDTKCVKSRSQVNMWTIRQNKPDERENGYCKALLLILSEIRRQKPNFPKPRTVRDYKPVIEPPQKKRLALGAWAGR